MHKDYAMPTVLERRLPSSTARLRLDTAPFVIVLLLSLLFALAFWSAFAPHPMPDQSMVALQGGL